MRLQKGGSSYVLTERKKVWNIYDRKPLALVGIKAKYSLGVEVH